MKKILLVEDDPVIQNTLRTAFVEAGFGVTCVKSVGEGRSKLKEAEYDLFLFDINLPDGTSFELSREAHAFYPGVPLVFITANGDEESAVRGLSLGASDFIRKPFGRRELLLRLRRLLGERAGQHEVGELRLNMDTRKVSFKGTELALTPREFHLLSILMQNFGEAVSRDKLLGQVDKDGNMGEQTLNSHLSRVRTKLQTAGASDLQIQPVYGLGYRLEKKT